jgi:voltage-gated potassium channel
VERFSGKRFVYAVLAFLGVLTTGTIGFQAIIGDGWVASFYRSVVTTTLSGLDSPPHGSGAELFTIVLLLAGVAVFLYIAGAIVELIARGVLEDVVGGRRRRRAIERMQGHTIICGFGRVGRRAAAEFMATDQPFVVIDITPASVAAAEEMGAAVVAGDGTEDADLERAGLSRARALVASADSDEINLFITLSARAARPDLFIVARASSEASARKIRLAGANRVVQPYSSAGLQIANLVLKPQVAAFLDVVSTAGGDELRFEEIEVLARCGAAGRSIRDLRVRDETGALVVAIRKQDGTFKATPSPDATFEEGDIVIGVGTADELDRLEQLFSPRDVRGEARVG